MVAIIIKEEVPIKGARGRRVRRRTPWLWIGGVVLALGVGLIAGAAGWQATRSDTNAATRNLAHQYVAGGLWSPAQVAFLASNVHAIDEATGRVSAGRANVAKDFNGWYTRTQQRTEKLVGGGPNEFVTQWSAKGRSSPLTGRPFTMHGVSVITVRHGEVTRYEMYFDPTSLNGYKKPAQKR